MRIASQTEEKMVIKGDKRRIKRNIAYGILIIAAFIIPALVFYLKDDFNMDSTADFITGIGFPIVVLIGIFTVIYRESTYIVIDKGKGQLKVKIPIDKGYSGIYPLSAVTAVKLRHHGNPYYFPKLSILLSNDEEIILSSEVLISMPGPTAAVPLIGHVQREQKLADDIAAFIGVPYREIKSGYVPYGIDQADKQIGGTDYDIPEKTVKDEET